MAKNTDFDIALADLNNLAAQDGVARNRALDEVLKTDPSDVEAFRAAIMSHQEFWRALNREMMASAMNVGLGLFEATPKEGYFESAAFLDPDDATVDFKRLHQLAAEQRVKLGLKEVDEAVLIQILKNNPEECRAYLATQGKLGSFNEAFGWIANEAVPKQDQAGATPVAALARNLSTGVLTDGAIQLIKQATLDRIVLNHIEKTQDPSLLNTVAAASDEDSLKTALKAIGTPQLALNSLHFPLPATVKKALAKACLPHHINTLLPDDLLAFKGVLESTDPEELRGNLPDLYQSGLDNSDVISAKALIGTRYLLTLLPTISETNLLIEALNADTLESAQHHLISLIPYEGSHDFITNSLTPATLNPIKTAMLAGVIAHLPVDQLPQLISLSEAKSVSEFKTALGNLRLRETDWVTNTNEVQQWARERAFALQIEQASRLGSVAHPQLINAFKALSADKQANLLQNTKQLPQLLHAKDTHVIEHYLGRNAAGVNDILIENQRANWLRGIHNSEVAKLLASFNPPVRMSKSRVDAINNSFVRSIDPPVPRTVDWDDPEQYQNWLMDVKSIIPEVNESDFFKAFGFDDNTAFLDDGLVKNTISKQHAGNVDLFLKYHHPDTTGIQQALLTVFLAETKPDFSTPLSFEAVDRSTHELWVATEADKKNLSGLKKKLNIELAPLYKAGEKTEDSTKFAGNNKVEIDIPITKYSEELGEFKKNRLSLTKTKAKFSSLLKINALDLMSPAFQYQMQDKGQSKRLLDEFKELAQASTLIVNQLRREQSTLSDRIGAIPAEAPDSRVKKLKVNLESELKAVEADLAFYSEVQTKVHGDSSLEQRGLLQSIEEVVEGKVVHIYKPEAFKCKTYQAGEAIPARASTRQEAVPVPTAQLETNAPKKESSLILSDKLGDGQVRVYDYETDAYSARFTEQHTSARSKLSQGKFEITAFPQTSAGTSPGGLVQAKVQFSLAMAIQTLSSMDSMPNKNNQIRLRGKDPEQLKYLYAALLTLGVDKKAINVTSQAFNPDSARSKLLWFTLPGFNKTAFPELAHVKHAVSLKSSKEALQNIIKEKSNEPRVRKQVVASTREVVGLYKKQNNAIMAAQKSLDEEGPAPIIPPKVK